jgi:hypothetical protein
MREAMATLMAVAFVLFGPARTAGQEPLRFGDVRTRVVPTEAQLETEELLAAAAQAAVGGSSLLGDGITTGVTTGPRHREGAGTSSDLAFSAELPLRSDRSERAALGDALGGLAEALRLADSDVASAELARAFVDAWLAQELVMLREQDLTLVESWLGTARRRVEAGADPPFEATLVAGEHDRALVELMAARRQVESSWGELVARAELPPRPRPLSLAGLPGADAFAAVPVADPSPRLVGGLAARRALGVQLARVDAGAARSRWALAGEAAREGDERLARVGVAYRFPLRGESSAIGAAVQVAQIRADRDAARRRAAIQASLAAASAAKGSPPATLDDAELERAQAALTARLEEGKERASEVLPLRRQLVEARVAALAARAARLEAGADLFFLGGAGAP